MHGYHYANKKMVVKFNKYLLSLLLEQSTHILQQY